MTMAATGSNHTERHLAQPPRGFLRAIAGPERASLPDLGRGGSAGRCPLPSAVLPGRSGLAEAAPIASARCRGRELGRPVVPILFPLEKRVTWTDTFGAARSGGRTHAGNDLMAPKMTPILAVVDGKLDWLNLTGKLSSYNNLPYYNILLRGDDGNDYFYIHLNNDTPGTDDGQGGVAVRLRPRSHQRHARASAGDVIALRGRQRQRRRLRQPPALRDPPGRLRGGLRARPAPPAPSIPTPA